MNVSTAYFKGVQKLNNRELFRTAWAYARNASNKFGGKSSEYFPEALRQVREYGEEARQLEKTFSNVRGVSEPLIEAIRSIAVEKEREKNATVKTNGDDFEKQMGKIYFDNFVEQIQELPDPLYRMILNAMDRVDSEKWEIGMALNQMPTNILMYVGYMDLPSGDAIELFISDLLNYIPMSDRDRLELMDEFEDYSMG